MPRGGPTYISKDDSIKYDTTVHGPKEYKWCCLGAIVLMILQLCRLDLNTIHSSSVDDMIH